jgi:hypothetical protein
LDALERHDELVPGQGRYSPDVRAELLAMSSATIDRYLRGAKSRDQIKGKSTTRPSPLLRSSIKIRKAVFLVVADDVSSIEELAMPESTDSAPCLVGKEDATAGLGLM